MSVKWDARGDRMKSRYMTEMQPFQYISYWGTWRRFLGMHKGQFVEVELTPTNSTWEKSWKDMGVHIFLHGTSRGERDLNCRYLPFYVRNRMVEKLGEVQTAYLLTYDFFKEIDFDLYNKVQNGGAKFDKCRKSLVGQIVGAHVGFGLDGTNGMDADLEEAWDDKARAREVDRE
jgi:hypothetical protein